MTLRDQICAATDAMRLARQAFYQAADQDGATRERLYGELRESARAVLELRQQAERRMGGKVKTKITPASISNLIR